MACRSIHNRRSGESVEDFEKSSASRRRDKAIAKSGHREIQLPHSSWGILRDGEESTRNRYKELVTSLFRRVEPGEQSRCWRIFIFIAHGTTIVSPGSRLMFCSGLSPLRTSR